LKPFIVSAGLRRRLGALSTVQCETFQWITLDWKFPPFVVSHCVLELTTTPQISKNYSEAASKNTKLYGKVQSGYNPENPGIDKDSNRVEKNSIKETLCSEKSYVFLYGKVLAIRGDLIEVFQNLTKTDHRARA
jgi:hypothetical protein